jgi:hypothetical protein
MNRLHARILAAGLLLSPVLITLEELARLTVDNAYVEDENDSVADTANHLQAVADRLGLWHLAGMFSLGYAVTWCLALLAITIVIGRSRPMLAAVTGLLGMASVFGIVMHLAFYYAPLGALAQEPDRDLAARAGSIMGDDVVIVVGLILFLLGTLTAVLSAGIGLWRAHALPWWGALGLLVWLAYVVLGPEARVGALMNLALLLPFVAVARQLRATDREPARRSAGASV